MTMRLKQRFAAQGSDGQNYEICVWVGDINTSTLQGRSSVEGLPELRTSTGQAVNVLGKGRYQVMQTGVVLESSGPASVLDRQLTVMGC
jgi:hypothetical protein